MLIGQLPDATNREDFEFIAQIIDEDTGEASDLTAATINFEIRDHEDCRRIYGTSDSATADVIGITLPENDTFRLFIPRQTMICLRSGSYKVGMTVENAGITKSFIVGSLTVLDGVVHL